MSRNDHPSKTIITLIAFLLFGAATLVACGREPATTTTTRAADSTTPRFIDAISRGDIDLLKSLLAGMTKQDLNIALNYAAFYGNEEAASLLLDRGADVNSQDESGNTPLMEAAARNREKVVRLLIKRGARIEAQKTSEDSPLERAARKGALDALKALLEGGANANGTQGRSRHPIDYAAQEGQTEAVRVLVKAGARVNDASENGMTPIQWAMNGRHWDTIKALVENGADPNSADKDTGVTSLHQAALNHEVEAVRFLVEHSAKVDARTKGGRTPIDEARRNNASDPKVEEIVKILQAAK